jgi:Tfp pilus assembly protein PilV
MPRLNPTYLKRQNGFSVVEIMISAFIAGLLMLLIFKFSTGIFKFYARTQGRQQANMEARRCLDTIDRAISNARADTLMISTPDTTPAIPNSQVSFTGLDNASYTITWSTSPANSVHLFKTPAGSSTTTDSILSTHATVLVFVTTAADPTLITVSFRTTTLLDNSGNPDSYYTLDMPNRAIRMMAAR